MNYQNFSREDFIKDSYFRKWVQNPDEPTRQFWYDYLTRYPEQTETIRQAAEVILQLTTVTTEQNPVTTTEELEDSWQEIHHRLVHPVVTLKPLYRRRWVWATAACVAFLGQQNGLTKIRKISLGEMKEIEPYVSGVAAMEVPYTGIIDYKAVTEKYAEKFQALGGEIHLKEKVTGITKGSTISIVKTEKAAYETKLVINCAGLYSDKVAQFSQDQPINVRITPFRGEYFQIKPEREHLVRNLIYPVPDPNFPFLGVHFTRMIGGGVEAGPNAVLAFRREGYKKLDIDFKELYETFSWPGFQKVAAKYWQTGLGEMYRSFSKSAFTKALQELIPDIQENDLIPGGAGVRAQACDRTGGLLDDFSILEDTQVINVLNAPSPAATSSLSIGLTVSEMALKRF